MVRTGGLAILMGLAIHIIVNMFMKRFPQADLAKAELASYLNDEAGTWAIVHGARYAAFVCIAVFATGLYAKTKYRRAHALH